MFVGEGRLRGNIGVYVAEDSATQQEAREAIRQATAMKESIALPKNFRLVPKARETEVRDAFESPRFRAEHFYSYGVHFIEFATVEEVLDPYSKAKSNPIKRQNPISDIERAMIRSVASRGQLRVRDLGTEALNNAKQLEARGLLRITNDGRIHLTYDGIAQSIASA